MIDILHLTEPFSCVFVSVYFSFKNCSTKRIKKTVDPLSQTDIPYSLSSTNHNLEPSTLSFSLLFILSSVFFLSFYSWITQFSYGFLLCFSFAKFFRLCDVNTPLLVSLNLGCCLLIFFFFVHLSMLLDLTILQSPSLQVFGIIFSCFFSSIAS